MAIQLTIGGTDATAMLKINSAGINSQIKNQGDIMRLTLVKAAADTAPQGGQEIVLTDSGRFLFGGFITRLDPEETGIGQQIRYQVEASDYTYILTNRHAQKSYASQTLHDIVADLFTQYLNDHGFTVAAAVGDSPTITSINFNHVSLRKCFEKLAATTGYIWYVDYEKVVHFIGPTIAVQFPETFTDSSNNHISTPIINDVTQVRNEITVLGGTETASYTQNILGNGTAREWLLVHSIKTITSVKLNGVTKTFGILGKDDEGSNYLMYAPTRGSVVLCSGSTTPTGTDTLEIIFDYQTPVVTMVNDARSIEMMKALEGGDGIHAYVINDSSITSKAEARQRAQNELQQFAYPTISGTITTRTGLLGTGNIPTAGQAIVVNFPSWGISEDTTYIIQSVATTMTEADDGSIEYTYEITFGGRLLGVVDFLQALSEPSGNEALGNESEIYPIHLVSEETITAETISCNPNYHEIEEEVVTAETISVEHYTPPFQYDDADARYNKAEYS